MPERQQRRWKGSVAKLATLAAALAAALLLAELVVRLLGFAPEINRINPEMKKTVYRISANPLLGYVFRENYRDDDDPDLKTSYPSINSHGFRDVERAIEKPPGVKRIILLGDSIVAGAINIRETDDTISRQLEKMLEPRNVEVLNMGINGYCTLAELELLKEAGLRYSPDLVILLFANNDYLNINTDLGMVTQLEAVQRLFVSSHLFRYLGVRFNLFQLKTEFGVQEIAGEWAGWLGTKKEAERMQRILGSDDAASATVKRHVSEMGPSNVHKAIPLFAKLAESSGVNLLIGCWPMFLDEAILDVETYEVPQLTPVFEKPMEIEELALRFSIPVFRFSPYFAADLEAKVESGEVTNPNPKEYYTSGDDMHPNVRGAEVAARALKKILEDNPGLLESREAGAAAAER